MTIGVARALAALGLSASLAFPAGAQDLVAEGQAILKANCARCHNIATEGESTHKDAPPFRVVVTRYAPETLAEALAEGITTGHPDMPVFTFEPEEIEAIIAYLQTLGAPPLEEGSPEEMAPQAPVPAEEPPSAEPSKVPEKP